jgi:hypothetical protein
MALTLRGIKTRYEVKEVIARGGMGVVYKAYDKVMKRPVALKTILDLTDSKTLNLFEKECEVLASLIHPNIVEIFDVGQLEDEGGNKPYLVMPLLPGVTLDKLIRTSSSRCQGKVESSALQQSRKFRFRSSPRRGRGSLTMSAAGSRPWRRCKAEATESAPKAIGTSPPRSAGSRAEGFPVQDAFRQWRRPPLRRRGFAERNLIAFGEIPERRLCIFKREDAGPLLPGFPYGLPRAGHQFLRLATSMAFHNSGPGRSKKPSIHILLPPRL